MTKEQIAIDSLKQKFHALERTTKLDLDDEDLARAFIEYSRYIGTSPFLSSIVRFLALSFELDREILYEVFWHSAISEGMRLSQLGDKNIGMPLFYNEEIEENFGLLSRFREMLTREDARLKEANKQNIDVLEVVMAGDDGEKNQRLSDDQLIHRTHIFHNQIIATASEQTTKKFNENELTIEISETGFLPQELRIKLGDIVRFKNIDSKKHAITLDDLSWGSGTLSPPYFF